MRRVQNRKTVAAGGGPDAPAGHVSVGSGGARIEKAEVITADVRNGAQKPGPLNRCQHKQQCRSSVGTRHRDGGGQVVYRASSVYRRLITDSRTTQIGRAS